MSFIERMETLKPFDILQDRKGQEVIVTLKNEEAYRGKLKSFDIHLNLVLFDSVLIVEGKEVEVGNLLIRGDNILTIRGL